MTFAIILFTYTKSARCFVYFAMLIFFLFGYARCQIATDIQNANSSAPISDNYPTVLDRPNGLDSLLTTTHFAIHYSITSGDSNQTTQAYAESTASFAELVWHIEYDSLGWRTPLSDGDTLYDIYIRKVIDGLLGRTIPEANGLSNSPCPSYMELRMGQTMSNLKHTLAHELHHASQYSYAHEARASDRGTWFYENTAEWASQYVVGFTNTQVLNRINGFSALVAPYHRITYANGSYEYGGALWCNFLCEWTRDSLVIRKIWEQMSASAGQQILHDIDTTLLLKYGKHLTDAIAQYALWRNFTGKRADTLHFKYAQFYTALKDTVCNSYPVMISKSEVITKPEIPGGCKYYIFRKSRSSVTFTFRGAEGRNWRLYVVALKIPQSSIIDSIALDSINTGIKTYSWSQADSFAVIPVLLDTAVNSSSFSFALSAFDSTAVSTQFSNAINGQNAGGTLVLNNEDTLRSGETRMLGLGSLHTIRPVQEFVTFGADSIYKHHDWNGTMHTFTDTFRVDSAFSLTAKYERVYPETLHVFVAGFPEFQGGRIFFHDPWYIESGIEQPDSLLPFHSPYRSSGIFLHQIITSNSFYSVGAESTQILGGFLCTFDHWDTSNVTLTPLGTMPGMNTQSVVYNAPNNSLSAIYVRGEQVQYIGVKRSWNMVSLPAIVTNRSARHMFTEALSPFFSFDGVNHTYTGNDSLTHGIGYWVRYPRDTMLPIAGTKLSFDTISVTAGWNIIGSLSDTISSSCIEAIGTTIQSPYFGYENAYSVSDTIIPGKAYWIRVNENGMLVLKHCSELLK